MQRGLRSVSKRGFRSIRKPLFMVLVVLTCLRELFPSKKHETFIRKKLTAPEIERAKSINHEFGYLNVMFYNHAYRDLVKSWVCNMKLNHIDVLRATVFFTSEESAAIELKEFDPSLWVSVQQTSDQDLLVTVSEKGLPYGSYAYFRLTLERLLIQNELIQHGINVFLTEADAVWLSASVLQEVVHKMQRANLVSADDHGDRIISAGFLLCRADRRTRDFFQDYVDRYADRIFKLRPRNPMDRIDDKDPGEQHLMTRLLKRSGMVVEWLNACQYARGEWYSDVEYHHTCSQPLVIQNNYIIGLDAKVKRAKRWGHWFLHSDGRTCEKHRTGLVS